MRTFRQKLQFRLIAPQYLRNATRYDHHKAKKTAIKKEQNRQKFTTGFKDVFFASIAVLIISFFIVNVFIYAIDGGLL